MVGKPIKLKVWEDNQAAATVVRTGKSQELRHVKRVHGVNICTLNDQLKKNMYELLDCHTYAQAADIFTKYFDNDVKWCHAKELIAVILGTLAKLLLDVSSKYTNNNDSITNKLHRNSNFTAVFKCSTPFSTDIFFCSN